MKLNPSQNQDLKSTFLKFSPVDQAVLGEYRNFSQVQVDLAVEAAHEAKKIWIDLDFAGRKNKLLSWAKYIANNIEDLIQLVQRETGKPHPDAALEVGLAIEHISWAAKNAKSVLATEKRSSGILQFNMESKVERMPLGVIGVIGPWNYPVFTPIGSIAYALAAGNTVVFKPSEFTPQIGVWLEKSFYQATGLKNTLITITGLGETGKSLTQANINKIAFTGSTATAKRVAEICAKRMIPVILECGGKDPVLVDKDADLKLAAEYALWSAMANAGQSCIGAERIYVHQKVFNDFTEEIKNLALKIKPGKSYGPATMPSQLAVIEKHLKSAAEEGVKFLVGGVESIKSPFVSPAIMLEVPENSVAMTEETFGPVIAINKVESMQEAVKLSNQSSFGLAAAVFSKRQGEEIASQLHCGMVSINSVFSFAAVPAIPFGGVKDSGYGRIHGPEGLLEFTSAKSVIKPKFKIPLKLTSFNRKPIAEKLVLRLIKFLHG